MPTAPEQKERAIETLIARRQLGDAAVIAKDLQNEHPDRAGGWVLGAIVSQQLGDLESMGDQANRAHRLAPGRTDVAFLLVDVDVMSGNVRGALRRLDLLVANDDLAMPQKARLASKLMELGKFAQAKRVAETMIRTEGSQLVGLGQLAAALTSLGELKQAESIFNELLKRDPANTDYWYLRSALKKAKKGDNHIVAAEARLLSLGKKNPKSIPVHFALARGLEEIGEYKKSFAHLSIGAELRRNQMRYDVHQDVATMAQIETVFSDSWRNQETSEQCSESPIFILGLPRSGTTLVDRILSNHSKVASLGEVNDFAYAVMRCSGRAGSKSELLEKSAQVDLKELGSSFTKALRGYDVNAVHLIDKTPANFLYLGLIAKALPNAKIIHLQRHPMASGHAMLKTLFRAGYPFSYDQIDLGRYIAAYQRLMAHWYRLFPKRILPIRYEELVADHNAESRKLLAFCELEWEAAVLRFEKNQSPTATASASQVRQPIHTQSVELWREYESELQPLADTLNQEGVAL